MFKRTKKKQTQNQSHYCLQVLSWNLIYMTVTNQDICTVLLWIFFFIKTSHLERNILQGNELL